jgi:hypothetical protein
LIVACSATASAPCDLLNAIMWAFLATKILRSGLLKLPFSGVPEVCAHNAMSEQFILEETLEDTFHGTLQAR